MLEVVCIHMYLSAKPGETPAP